MIKLIAIDMDGTLLNSKKELLEETKQYFKNFHNKNTETLLVLCTGRPEFKRLRIFRRKPLYY